MKILIAVATGLMVVAFATVATWLLFGDDNATGQPQRPVFAGIPADVLENAGVELTLPVQSKGLMTETTAREALDAEYRGASSRIKESALANLKEDGYNGPAWVFSIDTASEKATGPDGVVGRVDWHLIFVNAKNGEYLDEIMLNNFAPDGAIGPTPVTVPLNDPSKEEGPLPTPSS